MSDERLSDVDFQQYLMQNYRLTEAQAQRVVDLRNKKPSELTSAFMAYTLMALAVVHDKYHDLDLTARMLAVAISYAHRDGKLLTTCPVNYVLMLRDGIISNPD